MTGRGPGAGGPPPEAPAGVAVEIPVEQGDLDAAGRVRFPAYFRYSESARGAYFAALELDRIKPRPGEGARVAATNVNVCGRLRAPGPVSVSVYAVQVGAHSFILKYDYRAGRGGPVVAEGTSVETWVDHGRDRLTSLPDCVADAIAARQEGSVALRWTRGATRPGRVVLGGGGKRTLESPKARG